MKNKTHQTTEPEKRLDRIYLEEYATPLERIFVRIFRGIINKIAKVSILRAFERGQIDSEAMHHISATIDRIIWPKE